MIYLDVKNKFSMHYHKMHSDKKERFPAFNTKFLQCVCLFNSFNVLHSRVFFIQHVLNKWMFNQGTKG